MAWNPYSFLGCNPETKNWLYHSLAVWPWVSHSASQIHRVGEYLSNWALSFSRKEYKNNQEMLGNEWERHALTQSNCKCATVGRYINQQERTKKNLYVACIELFKISSDRAYCSVNGMGQLNVHLGKKSYRFDLSFILGLTDVLLHGLGSPNPKGPFHLK